VTPPRILIIAGSDSCGGAGIQADIKTVTMLGGHAMTAITAITAQNSLGVESVMAVPTEMVLEQIRVVERDIRADAVKIGMIGSAETARALLPELERYAKRGIPIVLDPVMVSTSGDALADEATKAAIEELIGAAIASLVTPNVGELAALGGDSVARRLDTVVLAKGGDAPGDIVVDRLLDPSGEIARWSDVRIPTRHTHGTGCTLASAIAVGLGRGDDLIVSIERARDFVRAALASAPGFGAGCGPVGHALGAVPFEAIHRKND
jgi:hydroxymethylpyrimidine/phosphomethylpyrimidine kinase